MLLLLTLLACTRSPDDKGDTGASECAPSWFPDADADGYGDSDALGTCAAGGGRVENAADCDDTNAAVSPDAAELCDGLDQDCNGATDDGLPLFLAAPDVDADGYGSTSASAYVCALPAGWIDTDRSDCDDASATTNPGGVEVCDGADNDCDGLVDDADASMSGAIPDWYPDADGDGYGGEDDRVTVCAAPAGYLSTGGDCDDAHVGVFPGAIERCLDYVDDDCDGFTDDYTGVCDPVATEEGAGLCDPVVAGDVGACTAGVAAVLPSGATYATIQGAIDAAVSGDIVSVCPGRWTESLTVPPTPLSLAGYGSGVSILDDTTGILDLGTGAELTVVDLSFEGGTRAQGGAIIGVDATLCVARSSFGLNEADSGGAIFLSGAGSLSLENTTFYANRADADEAAGGALYVPGGYTLDVAGSAFLRNFSEYEAGAVKLAGEVVASFSDTVFRGNQALYEGGGLEIGGRGAGARVSLTSVTFDLNAAGYHAGALAIGGRDANTVLATDCTFVDNEAGSRGGAVAMGGWADQTFRAVTSTFEGNFATEGGAISLDGWAVDVLEAERCTFDGNSSVNGGGAIYLSGSASATATLTDSTLTNNSSVTYAGAACVNEGGGTLTSVNSDWGDDGSDNSPDDIQRYNYSAGANFVCSGYTCE